MDNFDIKLIEKYVPEKKQKKALKKLQKGYPVQYIIGNVDFFGIEIDVNKNVLIPRFETEGLVDKLTKLIKQYSFNIPNILDIGTGSGCISIYLKKNLECNITAIDKSKKAINLAKTNALKTNVIINFIHTSIEKYINDVKYDIIVSNPPYVSYSESVDEKIKYEPRLAIFSKNNGLYFYKIILQKSIRFLNKKNIIAFEIGQSQGESIKSMALKYYPNAIIKIEKDLNNKDRYIFIINE
ncbi:MAG: peptide chain release factor N(5)-glutamine methyltransferase [bacterium]|nr:peptide chain release factor N(5)-glutamine methyltransferase [bacterium]